MANKVDMLKIVITEQKRDYDYLLHIYNRMRASEGLLLTVSFGIVAYLYNISLPVGTKASISQRLSVPVEDYGKVIYFMAAGFFAYGLVKLMLNVFGYNPWMTAYEDHKNDYDEDEEKTLKYVKKRYDECIKFNGEKYHKRRKELEFLFYCLLLSAIILIVIKTLK